MNSRFASQMKRVKAQTVLLTMVTLALGIFAWPGAQSIADNLQVGYVDVLAADLLADRLAALLAGLGQGGHRVTAAGSPRAM